jgi:hypothetical protein
VSSISFLRSSSSSAFFLAALDFAFDAALLVRVDVDEGVADFRDLDVSFEVFFVAMRRTLTQLRVDLRDLSRYGGVLI